MQQVGGRYRAHLTNNSTNQTLWYDEDRGRLDSKSVTFPFDIVARNVGIGTEADSQVMVPNPSNTTVIFAGLMVHQNDLVSGDWAFLVVGQKGGYHRTVEGKTTIDDVSAITDEGHEALVGTRADLRLVGDSEGNLTAYWQGPNPDPGTIADSWILYDGTGNLPGPVPDFGTDTVQVGLITYAGWSQSDLPVVGTCDALEDYSGS